MQTVEHGVHDVGPAVFVICKAAAYRTPDDPKPCHGIAWEPFPGPTPFTRDCELMNAADVRVGPCDRRGGHPFQEDREADEVQARQQPAAETAATVNPVTKAQHGKIGALVKDIAAASNQTADKVAQDSRAWIKERYGKKSRADLTTVEAGELIDYLEGILELAKAPIG